MTDHPGIRGTGLVLGTLALAVCASGGATASNAVVGLSGSGGEITVPTWLYLASGGGVIGAMALLSMLVTDRVVIEGYHDRTVDLPIDALHRVGDAVLGIVGIAGLAFVLVVGVAGPQTGLVSGAVLLVFVGARAVLTMVAYAVGNPWPAINPWRRVAAALPTLGRSYPRRAGHWPAVAALLALIWLEVVAPLSSSPRALAAAVAGYSLVTVAGGVVFPTETWFRRADPLSVWFRCYGSVAPIQRTDDGLALRAPGARLGDDDVLAELSGVAFAVLLVWELTYSGFIVTPPGARAVEAAVGLGLPAELVYLLLLVGGFAAFWGAYWAAAGLTRRRAETFLSRRYLAVRFGPALLAIAAGYHLAHYAGFAIQLWPAFLDSLLMPLSPPANPTRYALPGWFGYVEIAGILSGHVLAVWVAHTVSFELFPGKLQAIRSEYPFVALMIAFTVVSLLLVSLPETGAPYVPS
ncbi:hypothetical protein [Saliphagus sp. LR7]|uniref:hypothetical protein n=1 Tax=Saliphagus sp. LR7 TaxID=2282654 RepID=UPI000DF843B4|nr:hypothetical protein [Saliphagus sp. LR7]